MKKFLIYLVLGIALCCGASEGYVRYKGFIPYNAASYVNAFRTYCPVLGWAPEVGKHEITYRKDRKAYETIWPDTSRASREQPNRRTAKNILLVGCSITYGMDLDDRETWPWLLNERFPEATFDNFGVNGYGTYQSLLREQQQLATGKHYDYVVYCPIPDHIHRNTDIACFMGELKNNKPYYLQPRVDIDNKGNLLYFSELPPRWFLDDCLATVEFSKRSYYRYLIQNCIDTRNSRLPEKINIFHQLVQKMHETAQAHGSKFLLCVMANDFSFVDVPEPKQYKYPCIIATNGFEGEQDQPKFHVNGNMQRHPNGMVNKNLARIIGDYFENNNLL